MIVEWTGSALDRLADIFVAVDLAEQDAIEGTVRRINATLTGGPQDLGESRPGGRRVWFADPLTVVYRVIPAEGRVIVSHVAQRRRK
jgi:plasmid stabilization system protein ParE